MDPAGPKISHQLLGENMAISKSKLDKAGDYLAKEKWTNDEDFLDYDNVLDEYRKSHLEPLTEVTLKLQEWLSAFKQNYYIAQRLKRKPQILRKLKRFSIRLSQLQDIGGCRIIFESNDILESFLPFLKEKLSKSRYFTIERETDYREKGRDDSGYRAVHLIVSRSDVKLEIQLRSRIQHYWAESIERTSVIYGYLLKELEGDPIVLSYFKQSSNVFHEIECKRKPTSDQANDLDDLRKRSEEIIRSSDKMNVFDSYVNESFIKAMISRESSLRTTFHNWMIVFNWNTGAFMNWEITGRNPDIAIKKYSEYEKKWKANEGYEVVMIGSSDVSTIRQTHSHYFGIESYDNILEDFDTSILGFTKRKTIDSDARQILLRLHRHDNWGNSKVSFDTLRNHFCRDVMSFDAALETLEALGLIISYSKKGPYSLNVKKKNEIEQFL